jgi:serine/threonine-protein kinase
MQLGATANPAIPTDLHLAARAARSVDPPVRRGAAAVTDTLTPGSCIDRFLVEQCVGAGSMGEVYRCIDIELKRPVALKILSERHRENAELRARFLREGRAVAAISHPNVVQVFTTGSYDERPYIAMEFLDGVDLGTCIKEDGPWDSPRVARSALQAARGLEAAARAGLIHRDVKPSNMVLLPDGSVKVTDFGLAKPLEPGSEPALTAMGVVVGTPDYIAPEQARGDAIDSRVDIYALGGTMFYLLTGRAPFRTGIAAEDKYLKVVARHLRNPPPDPRTLSPRADPGLCELIRSTMAKEAEERPDYPALIAELSAIAERLGTAGASVSRPMRAGESGRGGSVAPTPFVGGDRRLPGELRAAQPASGDAETTLVRPPTTPPTPRPSQDYSATALPRSAPASLGRPLLLLTVVSILVFLTGLVLYLMRPGSAP